MEIISLEFLQNNITKITFAEKKYNKIMKKVNKKLIKALDDKGYYTENILIKNDTTFSINFELFTKEEVEQFKNLI